MGMIPTIISALARHINISVVLSCFTQETCASSSDSEVRVKPGGLGHGSEGHEDTEDISASQERSIDLLSKQSSSLSIGSVMEVEVSAIRAHGPPRVQPVFPPRHIASSKRRHSRLQALDLNTFTASEDLEELSSSAKDGVEEPTKALTGSHTWVCYV
jgi:hypothetical protein